LSILEFLAYGVIIAIILGTIGVIIVLVQGAATEVEWRRLRAERNLKAVNKLRAAKGLCPLEKEDIL
jgi:hypothetical protein